MGLKNYKKLFFGDATFRIALKNSIFFMIFSAVTQQIFGLLLAVMLTNIPKGRNIFKNIYYLPCVLSSAALGLLWSFLFNPRIGINNLLAKFGIEGPLWLMDSTGFIVLPMWVIAFVALWQYLGQNMMLYMAQITGISRDIYEASYIDGASKVKSIPLYYPSADQTNDDHITFPELYRFPEVLRPGLQHDSGVVRTTEQKSLQLSFTQKVSTISNTATPAPFPWCSWCSACL